MHKLELRGHLLYLNGNRQTLSKAEAHNTRKIPTELESFNHIDPTKVHLNHELVSLGQETLEGKVKRLITEMGIDLNKGRYRRPNKGLAIEWLFTVTPGFICDYKDLYSKSLQWLKDSMPNCPIVHAIIHFDEADPHMHVIMVPMDRKHLPASKILGFKGISRDRAVHLYETVAKQFGLSHPARLSGAEKKRVAEMTIKVCEKFGYRKILGRMWQPLIMAIRSRPEPFMEALRISSSKEKSTDK
jgi:hypothetical protein